MAANFAPFRGRETDLLVLHPSAYRGEAPVHPGLTDPAGQSWACAGKQLAGQDFVMELLTDRSEDGAGGTTFLAALKQGRMYSDVTARQEFNIAASQALASLQAEYTDETPDDQRLESFDVRNLVVTKGRVAFHYTLRTAAGEDASFILPVPISP